ncbi:MAG: hypothetical protein NT096_01940 [Proteobacteria bacterium]|nr:hypothetical protein [Pseudomonadota bacterium]
MSFKDFKKILQLLREFYAINKSAYKNSKNTNITKKNSELRDKYNGKRIIIIYTGTSVDHVDFKLLKDEYVFGCSLLALHKNFDDLDVNFYAEVDTWGYRLHYFYSWLSQIIYTKTKPGTKIFFDASSYELVKKLYAFREKDTHYLAFNSTFFDNASNVSIDIEKLNNIISFGIFSASICISIYMGFKNIYLVGADYTKDPMISGHFYDGVEVCSQPSPELVQRHEIINEFSNSRGVTIYNVVDNGFDSRTFKQIRTEEFVKMIQSNKKSII